MRCVGPTAKDESKQRSRSSWPWAGLVTIVASVSAVASPRPAAVDLPQVNVAFDAPARSSHYVLSGLSHIHGRLGRMRARIPWQERAGDRPKLEIVQGMGLAWGGGHTGRASPEAKIPILAELDRLNAAGTEIPNGDRPIRLRRAGPGALIPSVGEILSNRVPVLLFRNMVEGEEQVSASPAYWVEQRPGGVEVVVLVRQLLEDVYRQKRHTRELEKARARAGYAADEKLTEEQTWALGSLCCARSIFPPGIPDSVLERLIIAVAEHGKPILTDYGNYAHTAMVKLSYPTGAEARFPVAVPVEERQIISAYPAIDFYEVFSRDPRADSIFAAEQLAHLVTTPPEGVSIATHNVKPPPLRRAMRARLQADLERQLDALVPRLSETDGGFSLKGLEAPQQQMLRRLKDYQPGAGLEANRALLFEGLYQSPKKRKNRKLQLKLLGRIGLARLVIALNEQLSLDAVYGSVATRWSAP